MIFLIIVAIIIFIYFFALLSAVDNNVRNNFKDTFVAELLIKLQCCIDKKFKDMYERMMYFDDSERKKVNFYIMVRAFLALIATSLLIFIQIKLKA